MTARERKAIRLLRGCSYQPGSFAKQFVRDLSEKLKADTEYGLSPRQHEVLMEILHSYRRQHKSCFCAECEEAEYQKAMTEYLNPRLEL